MAIAGESNGAVRNLWTGKIQRGFRDVDGRARAREVTSHMRPVAELPGRHMIFPAEIPGVMRMVRKIARGLCHHHKLLTPVLDEQVWADVSRFRIPDEYLDEMYLGYVHPQVARYRYAVIGEFDIHSVWLIEFFGRTEFMCIVYDSVAARQTAEVSGTKAA